MRNKDAWLQFASIGVPSLVGMFFLLSFTSTVQYLIGLHSMYAWEAVIGGYLIIGIAYIDDQKNNFVLLRKLISKFSRYPAVKLGLMLILSVIWWFVLMVQVSRMTFWFFELKRRSLHIERQWLRSKV